MIEQRAHISRRHLRAPPPSRISADQRAMPVVRIGFARLAKAATARSRSPSFSPISPSVNQAEAYPGTSSSACSSRSAAPPDRPWPRNRAPIRSGDPRRGRRTTEHGRKRLQVGLKASESDRTAYLKSDAARRPPHTDTLRRVLQARRLSYRPDTAGGQGHHHAWPFRPCARRAPACAGDARDARHHGLRYGDNFAGSTQAIRYGESVTLDGVTRDISSGRACARFRPDRGRAQG